MSRASLLATECGGRHADILPIGGGHLCRSLAAEADVAMPIDESGRAGRRLGDRVSRRPDDEVGLLDAASVLADDEMCPRGQWCQDRTSDGETRGAQLRRQTSKDAAPRCGASRVSAGYAPSTERSAKCVGRRVAPSPEETRGRASDLHRFTRTPFLIDNPSPRAISPRLRMPSVVERSREEDAEALRAGHEREPGAPSVGPCCPSSDASVRCATEPARVRGVRSSPSGRTPASLTS